MAGVFCALRVIVKVLVASANNRRAGYPVLDMNALFSGVDSVASDGWVTTFNNETCHDLLVSKEDVAARWRSFVQVRGYVYPVTRNSVSFVSVSGSRCPVHRIESVKFMGNKEVVDLIFIIDYTCVKSTTETSWTLGVRFPDGFTPMCCASKHSDFQYLAVLFRDAGVMAVDVSPVGFTLIWDMPCPCSVELSHDNGGSRTIRGQLHKMEVLNVDAGNLYTVKVSSEETTECHVLSVAVPSRTLKLMEAFFNSRRLADQTYDLTSVSEDNVCYLRRNSVLKSGQRVLLRPTSQTDGVELVVATCGDTVELSSAKNIYVVPEFADNRDQYICLQQNVRNFMIEFDRSESYVKYDGQVYPHGSDFALGTQRVQVVKGSIILLVSAVAVVDAVTFPGGVAQATAIRSSGDVVVRDLLFRDLYQVGDKVAGETTYVANSFFVYDSSDNSTTECSRVSAGLTDDKNTGSVTIDLLNSSSLKRTFATTPAETSISCTNGTDDTTATFASTGLHFDSDRGDIYFGADRDFRIHFADVDGLDPAMLQIQSLSGSEYVTRFLVTSEL